MLVPIASLFFISIPIYCSATNFTNATVENIDGGVRVNFTLSAFINAGTYIIFTECLQSGINDTSNTTAANFSLSCSSFETTELQNCCDSCIANNSTQAYVFLEGPLIAGEEYECSVSGFLDGSQHSIVTENVVAVTGVPSLPGLTILVETGGTLNLTVGSEYNGGDTSLKYRVRIQNESDYTIHDNNYTAMNFIIEGELANGDYNVTVWTINRYGSSEAEKMSISVNVSRNDLSSSSSPSSTVTMSESKAEVAAIVGGVVGGVVVIVAAIAIVIAITVVVLIQKKKNSSVNSEVPLKVIPVAK